MLQNFIFKGFQVKIPSRTKFFNKLSIHNKSCRHCGSRLYSSQIFQVLHCNLERKSFNRNNIFNFKTRCYTSEVDAQKKNGQIETLKEKTVITTNVKLKSSELRRLFSLAGPEKWTLTGNRLRSILFNKRYN